MASKDPTTQREALAVQMLEEIDVLVRKLDEVSGELRANCEQAVSDAAGKALLHTQMNFESVLERGQGELLQAARAAAAKLGNELNRGGSSMILAAEQMKRRLWVLASVAVVTALAAGIGGGYVGARLAMGM